MNPVLIAWKGDWARRAALLLGAAAVVFIAIFAAINIQKAEPESDATLHAPPKPLPTGAATSDWPSPFGPTHNLVSSETNLLHAWPATGPTLVWELPAGEGWAAPAVQGERLVYFHRVADREVVECLHAQTGERFWKFDYPTNYRDRYGFNNGPRASPVIDEKRVYLLGVEGKLHCLNLESGAVVWMRNTTEDFNVSPNFFGVGSTPLVEGKLLIVQLGAPDGACVVAFNKFDGKVVWKTAAPWTASYASPIPAIVHGQRRTLVFTGGDSRPPAGGLLSIDPHDGRIDARFPFRSTRAESVNASNPVCFDNHVFLSSSYRTGGVLIRLKPDGGCDVAWKTNDLGAHFSTPIYLDGYLYGITGAGLRDAAIVCLDWKTGRQQWRETPVWTEIVEQNGRKQEAAYGPVLGTLVRVDGAFLLLGQYGHLAWVDLSPGGYRELRRTWLFNADETWTPPVISRGLLYVCQNRPDVIKGTRPRLLCYDLRAGSG